MIAIFKKTDLNQLSFLDKKTVKLLPFVVALLLAIVVLAFFNRLPEQMPLFYSLPWGEGQLAKRHFFLIIPAVVVSVTSLNLLVLFFLHQSQKLFRLILLLSSLIVTAILSFTFLEIVFIYI